MTDHIAPWPDAETLKRNEIELRRRLEREIAEYELRYELPSARVYEEIDAGRLRETNDVCSWLFAYDTLQMLVNGAAPRTE